MWRREDGEKTRKERQRGRDKEREFGGSLTDDEEIMSLAKRRGMSCPDQQKITISGADKDKLLTKNSCD